MANTRTTPLRPIAISLAILFVLLAVMPFVLYDRMPRDPVEPHKISLGAGAVLRLFWIAAFAVGLSSLLTAIFAFLRRDRVALAIALPAPCLAAIALGLIWLDGM